MAIVPPVPVSSPAASVPDAVLLNTWVKHQDEDAFRTLAHRHFHFVIATAGRCTGHPALAEEATQMVLTILARKAASLERVPLSPWLHRTTVLECRALLRRESRHRRRVNALALQPPPEATGVVDDAWQDALPLLDEVIDRLGDEDRRVVLLRFFEDMSFREIAGRIGKSEAAAQRQGHRALERLGLLLRRRGVALPAAALTAGLTAAHASSIPAAACSAGKLIANIFSGAMPPPGGTALLLNSLYTMSQIKLATVTAAVITVLAAVPIGLQYKENSRLTKALAAAETKLNALTDTISPVVAGTAPATKDGSAAVAPASPASKARRLAANHAAIEGSKPGEKNANPLAGLGAYLDNPQMKKVMEAQFAGQVEMMYGPFMDSLALSPDERKNLTEIMTYGMGGAAQDALKAINGTPEDRKKLIEETLARTAEQKARIKEFLNDEGDYRRFQAWEERLSEHQTMSALKADLAKKGASLDPKKEEALVELMYKDRQTSASTTNLASQHLDSSSDFTMNPEKMDAHVDGMLASRDRVAAAALKDHLLTPAEAESFRAASQAYAETTRAALKMAATVMGNLKKSGEAEAK